jgi:hypothetical protein
MAAFAFAYVFLLAVLAQEDRSLMSDSGPDFVEDDVFGSAAAFHRPRLQIVNPENGQVEQQIIGLHRPVYVLYHVKHSPQESPQP